MRLSLIYDDVQAALAASVDFNDADKPLCGGDIDGDLDISNEEADRKPTEPAERLRPAQLQNEQHTVN
jgi:hypothetical protein